MNLLRYLVSRSVISSILASGLRVRVCASIAGLLLLFSTSTSAHNLDQYADERAKYLEALGHLTYSRSQSFYDTLASLQHYPLYPYLEYEALNSKLRKFPAKEVSAFVEKYSGEPIAKKMTKRWLNQLVRKHRWQQYVEDWDPSITDARLNCWYLRAMYRTGRKVEALSAVQPLWLKASSQPKACDPLFKEWIEEGFLTQDVAWQRLELAMDARRTRLASYIARKLLKDDFAEMGKAYVNAHRRPHKLSNYTNTKEFSNHPDKLKKVVVHGLKRLARKDSDLAKSKWKAYKSTNSFSEAEVKSIDLAIAVGVAANSKSSGDIAALETFSDAPAEAIEKRIRLALGETDWPAVFYLIESLPEEHRKKNRWRYWLARSMEEQKLSIEGVPSPQESYLALSKTRSYYGFLAADLLSAEYAMQDQPAPIPEGSIDQLSQNLGLVRSVELFALNQKKDARKEWWTASKSLDPTMLLAAGKLAEDFGWYEKAIRSYIKAQYWNDLETRFPLAYEAKILNASKATKLDTSWLFAIARQESAFSPDAKSHAGALGLMQIMPRTASQTARQIGLKFKRSDLLKPETNIHIGSSYLKALMKQFNGNRILATTAYNAGPHRVKSWLKRSKSNLPFDVWIETIPFKETRSYVQNVLAFSVIYDYRRSQESRLVTSFESEQLL